MRIVYLFILTLSLLGCNINQKTAQNNKPDILEFNCPDDGNCVFEVLKNSSLQLKYDEFGKLYPEIVPGDKLVVKYLYKKNEIKNTADNSYSEYVYLEIDEKNKQIILKDKELQKVKMLFGRICFCRDATGYFKVTQGSLFIFNNNGKLLINTKFNVSKVPQIITEINENIKY
jgi:hypothetical protein